MVRSLGFDSLLSRFYEGSEHAAIGCENSMGQSSIVYSDLAYIFVAALLGGLPARRLRQPFISS
jgi:hypothetical protein